MLRVDRDLTPLNDAQSPVSADQVLAQGRWHRWLCSAGRFEDLNPKAFEPTLPQVLAIFAVRIAWSGRRSAVAPPQGTAAAIQTRVRAP